MCVHDLVSKLSSDFPLASQFQQLLHPRIPQLSRTLHDILDLDSDDSSRVAVYSGIDERLDALRQQHAELPAYLTALQQQDEVAGFMLGTPFDYYYLQQLGFFVHISLDENIDQERDGLDRIVSCSTTRRLHCCLCVR
jgi:hypothetical protein